MFAAGLALALSLPATTETSDPSPVELSLAADGSLDVVARWAAPHPPRTRGLGASAHVHGGPEGSPRTVPNDTFRTILPEPARTVAVGDLWGVDRSGVETIVRRLHPGADVSSAFALFRATNDRHSEVVFRVDVTPPPADGGADRDAPAAAPFFGLLRIDRERGAVVGFRLGPTAKPFAPAPRRPASRGATAAAEPPATRELVGGAFDHDVVWTEEVTFEAAARALERAARPTERTSGGPRADDVLAAIDAALARARADGTLDPSTPGWRLRMPPPPDVAFAADAALLWRLDTTKGMLVVRLRPDVAPKHVTSTIHLTRAGFYDGLSFHRVLGGFMAQGGCPLGTGTGDPGYVVDAELDDAILHDRRGVVSAANAGEGTDGSQWFVTFAPAPTLDGLFTIFGEVVDGEETLAAIERCAQSREQMQRTYCEAPLDPITIRTATVGVEGE